MPSWRRVARKLQAGVTVLRRALVGEAQRQVSAQQISVSFQHCSTQEPLQSFNQEPLPSIKAALSPPFLETERDPALGRVPLTKSRLANRWTVHTLT